MVKTLTHRALVGAVALALASGCSGNSSPVAPGQPGSLAPSSRQIGLGVRILPGPAVSGPTVVPLVPHRSNLPHAWPAKKKQKQILFVSDLEASEVLMYDPKKANPPSEGSISDGVSDPAGLAVDEKGALYVSNLGNNTITVYPAGKTSPSLTIDSGLDGNYGVAVDSKGDVFATNLDNNTVTGYRPGKTSPYETITGFDNPVGIAVDDSDNVYVACDSNNTIYIIPAGSSEMENSGLTGLSGPIGVAFGEKDVLYVANFAESSVGIYPKGSTSPSGTITDGIDYPTLDGFTSSDYFFQSNQGDNVVGYKKGQTSPFSTITGNSDPLGVASSPKVKE